MQSSDAPLGLINTTRSLSQTRAKEAVLVRLHAAEIADSLQSGGWASLFIDAENEEDFANELVAISGSLGVPVGTRSRFALVDRLTPTSAAVASKRSLSYRWGLGEFPLHCDTAHWTVPCRYIVLGCFSSGSGARATELLDTFDLALGRSEIDLLRHTPFRVVNGRKSFFDSILSRSRSFVRLDPGCMEAMCGDGEVALSMFEKTKVKGLTEEVHWTKGQVLILDNWRVLHGRGESAMDDGDRVLLRVTTT